MMEADTQSSSRPSVKSQQIENLEFKNPAEVRELIRRLQMVEERMEKKTNRSAMDQNSNTGGASSSACSDFDSLPLTDLHEIKFESEDSWLMATGRPKPHIRPLSELLDSHLLSIRYDLLHAVKQALEEDKQNQMNIRLKRNTSYLVHREHEPQDRTMNMPFYPSSTRDVSASYTYRVPKSRMSPARGTILNQQNGAELPSPIMASAFSPPDKTVLLEPSPPPADRYRTITRSTGKLGTTFTSSPVETAKQDGTCHELNVTFTRSSEDEAISSPSGSAHSPRNNSMEELHSRARQQEQRLRETPIRRKDTQVIAYHDINEAKAQVSSRTSSAETYSVGDSNPDSGASSGVSSPRDSQSYENVQLVYSSIRRSMPNLAHLKEAQRGGGTRLQVMSPPGQIRTQTRYQSDPRLSNQQRTNSVGTRREASPYNNANGQRQSNLNRNQIPTYTRGDTFYKSRPQVLTIPPDQYEFGNVQPTDQRRPSRPDAKNGQTGFGNNPMAQRGLANVQKPSYNPRLAVFPSSAGGGFGGETEKPKSRIPAPGSRLRHF